MYKAALFFICMLSLTACKPDINTGNYQVKPLSKSTQKHDENLPAYGDFWSDLMHFNFKPDRQDTLSSDQKLFMDGLGRLMEADYKTAETIFSDLVDHTDQSKIRDMSGKILEGLYMLDMDFLAINALENRMPVGFSDDGSAELAAYYASAEDQLITFPDHAVIMKSEKSISGVAMIDVKINGIQRKFWIDTGADLTVLSSDLAIECKMNLPVETTGELNTSTDIMVDICPAIVDRIELGDIMIDHHRVLVVNKNDLEFKNRDGELILKIDGILGWNALRYMYMEIDYKNDQVTIKKPELSTTSEKNFFFETQPFVKVYDPSGMPFYFFLDTGASASNFYMTSVAKLDTSNAEKGSFIKGGVGGNQELRKMIIHHKALILGQHILWFKSINIEQDMEDTHPGFFCFDGVLGSDIGKKGTLILDFQNARFDLIIK